jgi:rRNA maturation RNase YbeY
MSGSHIDFHSECAFTLKDSKKIRSWLSGVSIAERKQVGQLNYIFCDDNFLHKLNLKFLNHDTYTDIITFDNTVGDLLSGDIYISVERVKENALNFGVSFREELSRVIVHGLLHLCGYTDKSKQSQAQMRKKENEYLCTLG